MKTIFFVPHSEQSDKSHSELCPCSEHEQTEFQIDAQGLNYIILLTVN